MDWTEISVTVALADTAVAEDICNMATNGGIYVEDYSDLEQGAWEIAHIDLIDEELIKKDRTRSVIHIYISQEYNAQETLQYIEERLTAAKIKYESCMVGVNDADWADNWKKYFRVTEIGDRLVICPSWESYDNTENKAVLKIDPGAAFGTGTHATTSLCLELLQKYVKPGDTVLDIGCGSGILSVAGVLLGAERAVGVDIDALAVKVAKENAVMNGVEDKTEYLVGDLAEKVNGRYSVVCANIVADIIMRLNENVADFMEEDALYITSGIIDVRAEEVKQNFLKNGFIITEELKKDNWYAFALKREA
ncbi:MAG: 50S ribosomal protein L11 methyltransferase [Clostridiales bacterium]|nr:50S ribosomal protein L11 methyltransferase [Candidatus Equinaster intestinalis]